MNLNIQTWISSWVGQTCLGSLAPFLFQPVEARPRACPPSALSPNKTPGSFCQTLQPVAHRGTRVVFALPHCRRRRRRRRSRVTPTKVSMPETAESHAMHLTTNRNCTVEVLNLTSAFCLHNPKVHMESGFPYSPPQPTVRVGRGEVCSFTKDDNTASGAVGVLTYELFHMHKKECNEMVAVMFSVPFDYTFYKNWVSVGVFPKTTATDHKLYELMYESKEDSNFKRHRADGSGVEHRGRQVDVEACMSDEGRAILKLEIHDKGV